MKGSQEYRKLRKKKVLRKKKKREKRETPSKEKIDYENYIDLPKVDRKKLSLLLALHKHHGLVSYACASVKISRKQFYKYLAEDEVFREAIEMSREDTLDLAECKLIEKINEGSSRCIEFYLDRMGRKRGYGKFQKIEYDPTERQVMIMGGQEVEF